MAEDIQGLIAKIQQEGVEAAEKKAREIEEQARVQAQTLVSQAQKQAQQIIDAAKEQLARMEKSSRASLEQAGRDLLLALRAEINALLDRLILAEAREALKPEETAKIITALLSDARQKEELVIAVGTKDLARLKKALFEKLTSEARKGLTLRPAEEINAGFTISYDNGKSHYDFTDKGIAEYLSRHLKPELAKLLNQSAASKKKTA